VVLYGCETWYLTLREEGVEDNIWTKERKVHNEKLHNLFCSPSITRAIKSRKMRWAGHIARMGRTGMYIGYWWESQKDRNHCEDQDVGGWTILRWI
jgi:hypothetical protein